MEWRGTSWPWPSGLPTTNQSTAILRMFKTSDAQSSKAEVTTTWCHCRFLSSPACSHHVQQRGLCANTSFTYGCLWQPSQNGANVQVVHYRYNIFTACSLPQSALQSILGLPARWSSWYFWKDNWKAQDSKQEEWCSSRYSSALPGKCRDSAPNSTTTAAVSIFQLPIILLHTLSYSARH
jgi:hypothetical protein